MAPALDRGQRRRRLLLRFPARTVIAVAYASVALCFFVLFTARSLPVAVVAATASGVPGAAALVMTGHHVQLAPPDHVRGRVLAAFLTSDAIAASLLPRSDRPGSQKIPLTSL